MRPVKPIIKPTGDPMPSRWPEPPRVNLWRWLSPLLVVSLGLHGLSLLVPVPDNREAVEREDIEEETLSIQVSDLPPNALEPEPVPTEEPPPPPVDPPPTEPPPAAVEPPPPAPETLPPEFVEPLFTDSPPLVPDPPTPTTPPATTPPTQRGRNAIKSSDARSALNAAFQGEQTPGDSRDDGFAIRSGFTSLDIASLQLLTDVFSAQYEPDVDANECLLDAPKDPITTSFLATVADDNGTLQIFDAQMLGRTGYDSVDDWIRDSLTGFSDSVVVTPAIVYDALSSRGPGITPSSGTGNEMYYFEIDVSIPPEAVCT